MVRSLKNKNVLYIFICALSVIALILSLVETSIAQRFLSDRSVSVQKSFPKGPKSVADVAEPLLDAVVNISTSQKVKGDEGVPLPNIPRGSPFEEFFDDFFNRKQNNDQQPRQVRSLGSGFVIDPSGLIVTNNHVIEEAEEIIASFNDGTKLKVIKILGTDPKTDLALLKVAPKKPLKSVTFGNSSPIRVGDWVMAIGNPFGLGGSLTVGIVSAKKRDINSGPYDEFIQTDAAINRGNSGGPLFNMDGKVIGVNTAIISPTGGSIGIGFAVPSNTAKHVINQLRKYGETRRGWLGVRIQSITPEIAESLNLKNPKGALVASITPGSPAAEAGLTTGDVIVKFNSSKIETMRQLPRVVANTEIDDFVNIEYIRKGKRHAVKVRIGRLQEVKADGPAPVEDSKDVKQSLIGLTVSSLTEKLRKTYKIDSKTQGIVVTKVEPSSIAEQRNIKPGDVIIEVAQEEVKSLIEVQRRVERIKKSGKNRVLLLLSDSKGDLRFVAVPIQQK
ncbi:MAG: Do family serine endopeptidase [Pseudomonadota bacterium]